MDKGMNDTLKRLLGPAEPELLCDECFEKIDEFVELELQGADADDRIPGMRAHLEYLVLRDSARRIDEAERVSYSVAG